MYEIQSIDNFVDQIRQFMPKNPPEAPAWGNMIVGVSFKGSENTIHVGKSEQIVLPDTRKYWKNINEFLDTGAVDFDVFAQSLVDEALLRIGKSYKAVLRLLMKMQRESTTKNCPTAQVFFDRKNGRYVLQYNPRFVVWFSMVSLMGSVLERGSVRSTFESLVDAVEFLLLHESFHIMEAHTWHREGDTPLKKKEHRMYNLAEDAYINHNLARVMGVRIPKSLQLEGVFDAVPVGVKLSLHGVQAAATQGQGMMKDLAERLQDLMSDLEGGSSTDKFYGTVDTLWINSVFYGSSFSLDQQVAGLANFRDVCCNGVFNKKSGLLPDDIKDSVRDALNKARQKEEQRFQVGEVVGFRDATSSPFKWFGTVSKATFGKRGWDYFILPLPSFMTETAVSIGTQSIYEAQDFLPAPGDIVFIIPTKQKCVVNRVKSFEKFVHRCDVLPISSQGTGGPIIAYSGALVIDKNHVRLSPGDTVITQAGWVGTIKEIDLPTDTHTVTNGKVSADFNSAQIRKVQTPGGEFKEGDLVRIDGENKIGIVLEDKKNGNYRIGVVRPEDVPSILNSGAV